MRYSDLSESIDVQSPEFKAWFADSKVVDSSGRPLRVYHGTDSVFSRFEQGHVPSLTGPDGQGFYFTPDPQYAANYGDIIMPMFLRIMNPYIVPPDAYEHTSISSIRYRKLQASGYDGVIFYGNPDEKRPPEFIVFHHDQIRSAITGV